MIVAGEASGDLHGARLLAELRRILPELEAFGLGSDELRSAGLDTLADSSEISVVGIVEALKILPQARRLFRKLVDGAVVRRPAAALLIDSPDFNLRLAKPLKELGVEVIYYISPQVWAWRKGRVHKIRRRVDHMLVLFPFEVEFYRRYGMDVTLVGHPLVDEVPELPQRWERPDAAGGPFRIALLPGSRKSEVEALLPSLVGAVDRLAERLHSGHRAIEVRLVRAPALSVDWVNERLAALAPETAIEVVSSKRFEVIADSHLALTASGTATLETGLLTTPMIVVYRLATWTYWLARWMVRLPHFSLVNLVLGRGVVPERLQKDAEPAALAEEAYALLTHPQRCQEMRHALAELRGRLGQRGASTRAARAVAEILVPGGAAAAAEEV